MLDTEAQKNRGRKGNLTGSRKLWLSQWSARKLYAQKSVCTAQMIGAVDISSTRKHDRSPIDAISQRANVLDTKAQKNREREEGKLSAEQEITAVTMVGQKVL